MSSDWPEDLRRQVGQLHTPVQRTTDEQRERLARVLAETTDEEWGELKAHVHVLDAPIPVDSETYNRIMERHRKAGPRTINQEDTMSMEKRAVVNTDKEKTAAKKVEKSLIPDKPNQQPKPPEKKDK